MLFKKAIALCLAALLTAGCATYARAEDWESAAARYEPILRLFAEGMQGNEDVLLSEDFNDVCLRVGTSADLDPMELVGYDLLDLDGDGSPELLIGETTQAEASPEAPFLFDIWTLKGGAPVLATRGWERNRLYLTAEADGRWGLYNEGANSAFESIFQHGKLTGDAADWQEVLLYNAESASPWTLNEKAVSEKEANSLLENWQTRIFHPTLRPFAADDFRVTAGAPELRITVTDTGRRNSPDSRWENVLQVTVAAADGTVNQQFEYSSNELPGTSFRGAMARLEDVNGDGFRDLVLLTAQGAYNEFNVFCLWNPETNQFDPVLTGMAFSPETEVLTDGAPLELVNFSADAEGHLVSYGKDGAAYSTTALYSWDASGRAPELAWVFDVYNAGNGQIGDRLYQFSANEGRFVKLWDHAYPESWYYGDHFAFEDRNAGADAFINSRFRIMSVANTNWVNLRERDSKQSPSLMKLNAGTKVTVLREGCADGWTLVLAYFPEKNGAARTIGYIWHSYLK